jgi:predicted RNase H-like nuclease
MATRRFIGLDLAWSARNPSGVAALRDDGTLVEARADLLDDVEIVAWVRRHLAPTTVIGIDMPTIVPNDTGMRPCERELAADFRRYHAAPHPSNRGRFGGEGRARHILDVLAADAVTERLDLPARSAGRYAFEVFPHAAHVRLFGLSSIFRYKKKARPWQTVLAEWSRYRAALQSLSSADPPLRLPASIPESVSQRGYKAWDDLLDAITCAYAASFLWRWGTAAPNARVYGDLRFGYIAVPGARVPLP